MDSNFSDQLKTVLSDPDAMATIAGLAKSFSEKSRSAPPPSSEEPPSPTEGGGGLGELMRQPAIATALRYLGDGSKERMALLQAMRPFVREEKKGKLDRIIQTMKTLDLLVSAQKLL